MLEDKFVEMTAVGEGTQGEPVRQVELRAYGSEFLMAARFVPGEFEWGSVPFTSLTNKIVFDI